MPTLYVLAGANGSGKTTWYTAALQNGFISADLPFVNVDLIARDELGGYNETNLAKAQMVARERMATYINGRFDFMVESNLAVKSDYSWIESLIKRGYVAVLYFLGTSDININYARVSKRIKEGGHAVPETIIAHRYKMGISYLKSKILILNKLT
jgi:predicted ABC-type ATPase